MLTEREKEILHMAKERSQASIAKRLKITQPAVSKFLKNIERKQHLAKLTLEIKRGYLTDREIKVYKLSEKGMCQAEIAEKLGITQPAVSDFCCNAKMKIKEAKEMLVPAGGVQHE